MLSLPQVTLCCVDTRTPQLALRAIERCTAGIRFAEVLLFTDVSRVGAAPDGVRLVDVRIDSVPAYSEFMLRGIAPYIRSSHWLIVQWDGFVLDPGAWRPEFLEHDYIGAPWPRIEGERAVGNGGFSLRSRRLLQALADPQMVVSHPEDVCICHLNRDRLEQQHGIRFAPRALAEHFAFERGGVQHPTFGFHGLFNFADVFDRATLHELLRSLPPQMSRGLDAHDLAEELLRRGDVAGAGIIIDQRLRLGMRDRRSWRLRFKRWWASRRQRPA
jgi:hypothetical protein